MKGHRFKLNRDRPGFHNSLRDEAQVDGPDRQVSWNFPQPLDLRSSGPLVVLENVSFGYKMASKTVEISGSPSLKTKEELEPPLPKRKGIFLSEKSKPVPPSQKVLEKDLILKNVNLTVRQGDRIAFVGKNGQGKTTLLSLIADKLTPITGSITRHSQAKVGYFLQNKVQDFAERPEICALELLHEAMPEMNEQNLRAHLAGFGLQGAVVVKPVSTLSGGQAVRLAMAHALIHKPQLLLLDEPTNHLDMDTIKAMIENLKEYEGSVVFVSHDQHLVSSVANSVYEVSKGNVMLLGGGMEEYIRKCAPKF